MQVYSTSETVFVRFVTDDVLDTSTTALDTEKETASAMPSARSRTPKAPTASHRLMPIPGCMSSTARRRKRLVALICFPWNLILMRKEARLRRLAGK